MLRAVWSPHGTTGSYAKGIAKREEILSIALDLVAVNGFRRTSIKDIADAVGLTQAGLLHYFDSKDELWVEVLKRRDAIDDAHDWQASDPAELLARWCGTTPRSRVSCRCS